MKVRIIFQFLPGILFVTQISAQAVLSDALSNSFEHTVWHADEVIGVGNFQYSDRVNVINFRKADPKSPYGNITEFKNNKFKSYNQGFCGNGSGIFTTGTYKVTGNKIDLFVHVIIYTKIPSGTRDTIIDKSLGTFYWIRNESGFCFLKDLRDAPDLDYLHKLQTHMPAFKYITSMQVISRFISIYDRYIRIVPDPNDQEYTALSNELQAWSVQAENWQSDAERLKITGEEEYREYATIVKELRRILSDTQNRPVE